MSIIQHKRDCVISELRVVGRPSKLQVSWISSNHTQPWSSHIRGKTVNNCLSIWFRKTALWNIIVKRVMSHDTRGITWRCHYNWRFVFIDCKWNRRSSILQSPNIGDVDFQRISTEFSVIRGSACNHSCH